MLIKLRNKLGLNRFTFVSIIVLFAGIGTAFLLITRAATSNATFEAEDTAKSGIATCADASASKGNYIRFGTTTCGGGSTGYYNPGPYSFDQCLSRTGAKMLVTGDVQTYRNNTPGDDSTIDARSFNSTAFPSVNTYPLNLGKSTSIPNRVCVVGGAVAGTQPESYTWQEVKNTDGTGIRLAANRRGAGTTWSIIDGFRSHNVEDGIRPAGTESLTPPDGDGFFVRNAYETYTRDDCIENDYFAAGTVYDSLFDGCYQGFSEQDNAGSLYDNSPADPSEQFFIDHVAIRLQIMPGPNANPSGTGHAQFFKKWSSPASNKVVVRDSVFYSEGVPLEDANFPFPAGSQLTNVTLVYGPGASKWNTSKWGDPTKIPGLTVVYDKAVWDAARTKWLTRHGCATTPGIKATSNTCTKLFNPDGF